MSMTKSLLAGAAALGFAFPALAGSIEIDDAYVLGTGAMAKSGAAFMAIVNTGAEDDRLIGVASDAAMKVELHSHKAGADGVMQMVHVHEGFAIPAGETHALARGGDHVMLMGLVKPLAAGNSIVLTLIFEAAGEMVIEVPVKDQN